MEKLKLEKLKDICKWVRCQTYEMCVGAGAGHIAPAFSCTEIFVSLYCDDVMKYKVGNKRWKHRDRLILSKGQGCASLYATLAYVGFFPIEDLKSYTQKGTYLGGHSESNVPGVEAFTGSLGNGIGIAVGIAWAAKLQGMDWKVYCVMGDGELNEGSCWEAFLFASHHKLDNLVVIVDRNKQQAVDFTKDVMMLEPLDDKFKSFGFTVDRGDGHSLEWLEDTLTEFSNNMPKCVIADTIKGKGVSFMECEPIWHYRAPTDKEQIDKGREELGVKLYAKNGGKK